MFKRIIVIVLLAIIALLGFAATKPDMFRVQRSTMIDAVPDKVFPLVNNFHNWESWSPWEKMDPSMKRSFGGPESGKGATYEWEGNDKVGKGKMEIADSDVPNEVHVKLDFVKPFEAHNDVDFTFEQKGDSTEVIWSMQGPNPYISKLMQVFMNMEGMIGKDFETGLANLKAAAEKK